MAYKRNKFNAKKTKYNGRLYHSKLEAEYAKKLDWRLKAKDIKAVVPQYKISIDVKGSHITNYLMDFKVVTLDDSIEMHEVKGRETMLWRLKWRLAKVLYPQWKFVLIKK